MGFKPRPIPRRVKVRNRNWDVSTVPPTHPQLATDTEDHNLGICDCHKREIYLDRTQSRASLQNTFYHELAHAFFLGAGLLEDYPMEERIVCMMTEWLIDLEAAGLVELKIK